MVWTTVLWVALLGATPPGFSGWRYPGAQFISEGEGGGSNSTTSHAFYGYSAATRDDYAAVVKYFQDLAGTVLENGSTDEIDVLDDSQGRSVALKIIARRWQGIDASITVVVSRAQEEGWTSIGLAYYAGERRSTLPNPFNPRDWTYPRAKVVEAGVGRSRTTTRDKYAAVVKYYQEKAGAIREDGTPLENGYIHEVTVNDSSRGRPVSLKTITRWWKDGWVTVVVSQTKGEEDTHIDLIYRTP
jgi:hypothetical protein